MLLFNESVIYTAHLQKTATETFEEMPTRAVARVSAVSIKAKLDNLKNNTILKALKND